MKSRTIAITVFLVLTLMILSGCQGNSTPHQPTATPIVYDNGLINGWLSTYDIYISEDGFLTFDWSSYQPASGIALVCCEKHNCSDYYQQFISSGNTIAESVEEGEYYRYAVWYGNESLKPYVQRNSVPESAWRYFYINSDNSIRQISGADYFSFTGSNTIVPVTSNTTRKPKPTRNPTSKPTIVPSPTITPDYSWHLQFMGVNTSSDDHFSEQIDLRVGETIYIHAKLTGGAPSAKILLYYEIRINNELIDSSAFQDRFGSDSYIWIRNTPYRYGTLSVRIFYYDQNRNGQEVELGCTSVKINARDDNSQTEIAKGWIPGCDIYFNKYGNLCFDMTNYVHTDGTIIYFAKNDRQPTVSQGTVTEGMIVWDTLNPGWIYEYAIWVGKHDYARDVATLSSSQIPESAWIKLSVTEDLQVSILSSCIPINILPDK